MGYKETEGVAELKPDKPADAYGNLYRSHVCEQTLLQKIDQPLLTIDELIYYPGNVLLRGRNVIAGSTVLFGDNATLARLIIFVK